MAKRPRFQGALGDEPTASAGPSPPSPVTEPGPPPADWPVALAAWYRSHRRVLPWRQGPAPYRVWVSEIMLQQTQVATVVPYYRRFLRAFPSPRALARADLAKVLKLWEGLGYYSRARHLHRAAQVLVRERGGRFPRTAAALAELPGIGAYTAAAIASIAFGERVPVVDGNVLRVFSRYWGIADDVRSARTTERIRAQLQAAIRRTDSAADFNQGAMELGALVCRPRQPDCPHCPLAAGCVARRDGLTAVLPRRRPRRPRDPSLTRRLGSCTEHRGRQSSPGWRRRGGRCPGRRRRWWRDEWE